MKRLIFTMMAIAGSLMASAQFTERIERDSLVFFYPQFSRIDLACGEMPTGRQKDVILCCEAAYTENLETTFRHANIDGDHVSGGVFYEGTPCPETATKIGNTGCFAYYDKKWHFSNTDGDSTLLHEAAAKGGMAFCQAIVYWQGEEQATTRGTVERYRQKATWYRVLAEVEGRLCIIESKASIQYGEFLRLLAQVKPTYAIYLDMGTGWNYSWYRKPDGRAKWIHGTKKALYTTNWVTFYL